MDKPAFTLYSHPTGTNGWTVVIVLKALNLSYETIYLDFSKREQKSPEYIARCENGRVPCLVDHGAGDFALWESKAIILYLCEKYDHTNLLGVTGAEEQAKLFQYLFFQASGQGPYFGQAAQFLFYSAEKHEYAIKRYTKEVARLYSVLNDVLDGRDWLVGSRPSLADLSFISWNVFGLSALLPADGDARKLFPNVVEWQKRLLEITYVAEAFAEKAGLSQEMREALTKTED